MSELKLINPENPEESFTLQIPTRQGILSRRALRDSIQRKKQERLELLARLTESVVELENTEKATLSGLEEQKAYTILQLEQEAEEEIQRIRSRLLEDKKVFSASIDADITNALAATKIKKDALRVKNTASFEWMEAQLAFLGLEDGVTESEEREIASQREPESLQIESGLASPSSQAQSCPDFSSQQHSPTLSSPSQPRADSEPASTPLDSAEADNAGQDPSYWHLHYQSKQVPILKDSLLTCPDCHECIHFSPTHERLPENCINDPNKLKCHVLRLYYYLHQARVIREENRPRGCQRMESPIVSNTVPTIADVEEQIDLIASSPDLNATINRLNLAWMFGIFTQSSRGIEWPKRVGYSKNSLGTWRSTLRHSLRFPQWAGYLSVLTVDALGKALRSLDKCQHLKHFPKPLPEPVFRSHISENLNLSRKVGKLLFDMRAPESAYNHDYLFGRRGLDLPPVKRHTFSYPTPDN